MYLLSNRQELAGRLWTRSLAVVAGARLSALVRVATGRIAEPCAAADEQPLDAARLARSAELFAAGLRDDSNLEMDWLWLASKVVREHERRYCLKRALLISPDSEIAKRELGALQALPDYISRLTGEQ